MRELRAVAAFVVVAGLLAGAGLVAGRYLLPYRPPEPARAAPRVEVAQPTPAAAAAERAPVAPETCSGLTEITDAELLTEVARRHALPDLRAPGGSPASWAPDAPAGPSGALVGGEVRRALLALDQTEQAAPWGVEVAATLAPGETQPLLTVIPREPPRFAWRSARRFELGLGGALAFGDKETSADPALYLGFAQQLAQTRRVDHSLKVAGVVSRHSTIFAGYVLGW